MSGNRIRCRALTYLFFRHGAVVLVPLEVKVEGVFPAGLADVAVVVAQVRVTQRLVYRDAVGRIELQHLLHQVQRCRQHDPFRYACMYVCDRM